MRISDWSSDVCSSDLSLPGASPETMASAVATPLEKQFSTIAGITSMTSVNGLGTTQITLQFDLGRNVDGAALDVQSAITAASRLLPKEMTTPPSFRKVNPADQPILFLALNSDTLPLSTVDEYRSEERRVGKECVSTCRSLWSLYHYKKQTKNKN